MDPNPKPKLFQAIHFIARKMQLTQKEDKLGRNLSTFTAAAYRENFLTGQKKFYTRILEECRTQWRNARCAPLSPKIRDPTQLGP